MNKISANTLIPISLVGAIALGASWLAGVQAVTAENSRNIQKIGITNSESNNKLDVISQRLSRIEGYLLRLEKKN